MILAAAEQPADPVEGVVFAAAVPAEFLLNALSLTPRRRLEAELKKIRRYKLIIIIRRVRLHTLRPATPTAPGNDASSLAKQNRAERDRP
ncbi:MAG TPA: hypothetical protein VNO83_15955 [Pseudonocardia sp.]|nr:hypothetical protein [Pseudonocardia sp.]